MKQLIVYGFCALISVGLLSACEDEESRVTVDELEMLKAEILDLIADKSCKGEGDCATIAFGAKPCGGPNTHLVFAKSNVDQTLLEEKVNNFNQLEHKFNMESGLLSDCAVELPPQVTCQDGVCVAL